MVRSTSTYKQFLLTTSGLLIVGLPSAVHAQVAANTANVSAPAGAFETDASNNSASDSDTVFAAIVATNDSATGINGASGATAVVNAFTADTINGVAASAGNATLSVATGSTVPAGLTFDVASGNVDVAAGTPAGTYTFDYEICETLNPTNCQIATISVTVDAAPITAGADTPPAVNGATGGDDIVNAFDNDTLNGAAVDPADITATITTPATPASPGAPVPVMDPATGLVDVPAGTPAGSYTITYEICETLNPSNCATSTVTVVVDAAPVVATNDSATGINGASGATAVVNAFTADTINGVAASAGNATLSVATGSTVPAGLTFDVASGNVDVAAGTPAGTYTFDYEICETLNPTNCQIATISVTVDAAPITAGADTPPAVNGATGGDDIVNAFDNDTLNGAAVDPADITATITTPATPASPGAPVPVMDPATGLVDVPAGTPAGSYTITYEICETLNPSNCATSTVTVVVDAAPVVATNDSATGINGASGATAVVNAFTADTINGVAASAGNATLSVATGSTVPAGLTFDVASGNVDVAAGTPAGTYTFDYEICETLNPTNCQIATISVTVDAAPITAGADTPPAVNGATGGDDIVNAFDNDTLNGAAVDPADITATITTPATPASPGAPVPVMDPATGLVDVPAGTPAGSYTITYEICETLNPSNCATSTVTVVVDAAPVVATNDSATGINGASGATAVVNAFTADTINGVAASAGNATLSVATGSTVPAGLTFDVASGNVDVAAGTPAGTYTFDYEICETLNPTNCQIATISVTVDAAPITAGADTPPAVNGATGGDDIVNAFDNDTLNGAAVDPADITATITTPATPASPGAPVPVMDPATGLVDVPAGTPAGSYTITYEICETLNPSNCATSTVTVVVDAAPVVATNDSATGINGASGATAVVNAFTADTINGVAASAGNATLSVATGSTVPAGLTFDVASGNVDVAAGTPAGTYTFDYEICETLNPTNCQIATISVTVDAAPITAGADTPPAVNGATGGDDIVNAFDNDTLNGAAVDPADITATITTPATPASPGAPVPVMDPATGLVDVPAGTPAGSYTITYEICETLNPSNCATSTVTVVVDAAPVVATNDSATGINGASGATAVVNAFTADTINGVAASAGNATLSVATGSTVPAGLTFDVASGNVDVAAGTPAGTYTFDYEICETLNPTNCQIATISVTVDAAPITAGADTPPAVNGATGGDDIVNAFDNDTLNGAAVDPADITATITTPATPASPGAPVPVMDPATGLVDVPAGTPAGSYTITYEICETLNPSNCATSTVTVVVDAAPVEALPDEIGPVDSTEGDPDAGNAYDNDTLNGEPVDPDDIVGSILTPATPAEPGAPVPVMNPITGVISAPPGTPPGTYVIVYEICEKLNPTNCKTGTISITIDPPVAGISGIVFLDEDGDGIFDDGENLLINWIVEIKDADGNLVATVQTDENGFYEVGDLPLGEYDISFKNPTNGVLYGTIEGVELTGGNVTVDQNLPIDPSGIVYDAITRQPVAGTRVTLLGANGNPLPAACFVDAAQQDQLTDADGFYRFDVVPGGAVACPVGETEYSIVFDAPGTYSDNPSTIIAPQSDALNSTPGIGSLLVAPQATAPNGGQDTTYYLRFILATGDRDVVHNHIPLDPFQNRSPLVVSKTSIKRSASVGDLIPYTISVRNAENVQRSGVNVIDIIPPGFKYVPGSSIVNNIAEEPEQTGRELRWNDQTIGAAATSTYNLTMVVGAGVTGGDRVNTALGRNGFDGAEISNRGQAVVSIVASAIFDCAEIIGKVFDDLDGDGYQDEGEPGIASVRLANVNGQLITTDEFGRYHITCAAVPDARIGSNYVLKVDTRTLPSGYAVTSENPRAVRLTRGKITKLNFGAKLSKRAIVTLDSNAFLAGSSDLKSIYSEQLVSLRDQIDPENPVIRIDYAIGANEDAGLAKNRAQAVAEMIAAQFSEDWGGPPASIETNVVRTTSNSGGE